MLTTASILGREFTLEQLKPLSEDTSEDRLFEILEEALAARVIEELPQTVGRYQFAHALIQETLAGELTTTRKVRLHARIGEALELLYGGNAEAHAAELAHHFAEAQTVLGAGKLVHYSLIAGELALGAYAYEEALTHFQRAWAARGEKSLDDEGAAILFGLARSQIAVLLIEESISNLRLAFDYYSQLANVGMAVAVAEYPLPLLANQLAGAPELIADAISMVSADSPEAGRLLANQGSILYFQEADYEGAQRAYEGALAIARRENDAFLERQVLSDAAFVDIYELRPSRAAADIRNASELSLDGDHFYSDVIAQYTGTVASIALGDSQSAWNYAQASLAPAEKLRHRTWFGRAMTGHLMLARAQGRWESARDFCDRGLELSPRDPRLLAPRALFEHDVGNFDEGEPFIDRLVDLLRTTTPGPSIERAWPVAVCALIARITGDIEIFDPVSSTADIVINSRSVTPFAEAAARIGKGIFAVMANDARVAGEQYNSLSLINGIYPFLVSGDRVLGLLSQTMTNLDQAATHFEAALTFCRKAGYQPELA